MYNEVTGKYEAADPDMNAGISNEDHSGDEIILTVMEHHSNIVPWHFLREKCGVKIKWIDCDDNGIIKVEDFLNTITDKTKLISITQMSNVLGSEIPLKEIIGFLTFPLFVTSKVISR